jgi:hypothetical protein
MTTDDLVEIIMMVSVGDEKALDILSYRLSS